MKDDSYEAKLDRALYELFEKKIARKQSHPLLYRLLRVLGFKVRPPHYATSRFVFTFCALYISVLFACLLWFVQRGEGGMSWVSIIMISSLIGVVFGFAMMLINRERKKSHQLTPWDDI